MNAMHPSIVRVENDKSCSFALRISSKESRIEPNSEFINDKCEKYLISCLENEQSIMIAGKTGSGKTELQKYLLSKLKKNTRVIVIDNVQELENLRQYEDLDLTSWQVTPNNPNASMEELIRNALRSNPDWLVVAEARGKEMSEVLTSVMTGHPIISTVHAYSLEAIPKRVCRMIMKADPSEKYEYIFDDVSEHIKIYVYLNRKFDNKLFDYIQAGVPIIASHLPEIERIITDYNIGTFIDNHDPETIAKTIQDSINNEKNLALWKNNLIFAAQNLCWENEEKVLEKIYLSL